MASNPLIPLQSRAPNTSEVFRNALTSIRQGDANQRAEESAARDAELQPQRQELLQSQLTASNQNIRTPQQNLDARESARVKSLATGAVELAPFLLNNDIAGATVTLTNRIQALDAAGIDSSDSQEALALLNSNPALLKQRTNDAINIGTKLGLIERPNINSVSLQTFAPTTDPNTGVVGVTQIDPNSGDVQFKPVPGAPLQMTFEQKQEQELEQKQALEDISVAGAATKARTQATVQRSSAIKKELGERNRNSSRAQIKLNEALILAKTASQGIAGTSKLKLSKLLPGVDVTNEAALDAALKSLALDQLQAFKGPTTDFEFGVVQDIAGEIGNSKESNIARINALNRANWFNQREFDQFKKHTDNDGDPDNFKFDFDEIIDTKKGQFSLRDIQDTAVKNNLSIEATLRALNK